MKFSIINNIIVFLVTATGLGITLWVYLANKTKKANQLLSLLAFLGILTVFFTYLSNLLISQAVFWSRMSWGIASLMFIIFYFFTVHFPRKEKVFWFLGPAVILLGLLNFYLSIFTDLIVKDTALRNWGVEVISGKWTNFFNVSIFLSIILGLSILFKKYFSLSKGEKLKVKYFLLGIGLFIIFSLIFNIFFPLILKTERYYYLGDYSIIFFFGFTAYAIVKHNLMGIKVVLTEFFIFVVDIILFVQIFLSSDISSIVARSIIFLLYTYFAYLLVRSVLREIKQREELERLNKELFKTTKELEKANENLKELDKAKDEFISMASHQLRTPLTAIKGYLSMLLEGDVGEIKISQLDFINEAFAASNRMVGLINDLLNVSRMEAGRFFMELKDVDLIQMVNEQVKSLQVQAQEKKLDLQLEIKDKIPFVKADEVKIGQVVMNFIDNAIHYTKSGGVLVKLYKEKGKVVFEVKDTGIGVSKEEQKKMFTKFFRAGNARKERPDGTGLGLYVAKRIVEDHGGEIIFKSQENKGSTFGFKLPIRSEGQSLASVRGTVPLKK